jgi:hypothetical protein
MNPDGNILLWTGDNDAPYVKVVNGANEPVNVNIVAGGGSSTSEVEGFTPHDDPDPLDENPVYIGGFAGAATRAPVGEGDRAGLSTDLLSRLRVRLSGFDGANPLDVPLDPTGAVFVGGQEPHDDPDSGNPLLLGGRALEETPAAVADADRVRWYFTLEGRGVVLHDLAFAGENLVHDVKMMSEKPLAVEDGSLLSHYEVGTSEVVKAAAGRVYSAWAYNNSGSDAFLLIRNAVATGAPSWPALKIADGESGFISFEAHGGLYFDTGIVVMLSTSDNSFAAPGAPADSSIAARFF